MPPLADHETLYWGLKFSDWVTVAGLIIGPLVAVALTLWVEGRRKRREQRVQVVRMLLATRHLPSDAAYSVAINLVPVEFNGSKNVMSAWRSYIEQVRYTPSPENKAEHSKIVAAKQTTLIFEMLRMMGFKLSETDIQTSAYAADGFVQRDNILIASQLAMPEIAATLKRQLDLMTAPVAPTTVPPG